MVLEWDSQSEGRGFKTFNLILVEHFFTLICWKNYIDVCLKRSKINKKEVGNGPFKKKTINSFQLCQILFRLVHNYHSDVQRSHSQQMMSWFFSSFSIDESSSFSARNSSPSFLSKTNTVVADVDPSIPAVPKTFPFQQQISVTTNFQNGSNPDYVNTRWRSNWARALVVLVCWY